MSPVDPGGKGPGSGGNVLLTVADHAGPNATPGSVAVVRAKDCLAAAVEHTILGL